MKGQASLQGDKVRATGKKQDDLQEAIAMLREAELDIPLQCNDFRDCSGDLTEVPGTRLGLLKDALYTYTRWQVIAMSFLGISAGLPFLLVFSTLNARLADVGVETATIGFFSWLGITYSIKVFWAPVVDRLKLPVLNRLFGKRRSWILLAQAGIATE